MATKSTTISETYIITCTKDIHYQHGALWDATAKSFNKDAIMSLRPPVTAAMTSMKDTHYRAGTHRRTPEWVRLIGSNVQPYCICPSSTNSSFGETTFSFSMTDILENLSDALLAYY